MVFGSLLWVLVDPSRHSAEGSPTPIYSVLCPSEHFASKAEPPAGIDTRAERRSLGRLLDQVAALGAAVMCDARRIGSSK